MSGVGILYLIQRESHSRLMASLFKILMLLISSTPYEFSSPKYLIVKDCSFFFFLGFVLM